MALSHLHQANQIRKTRAMVSSVGDDIIQAKRQTNYELDGIDQRIDRLTMLCEAMWELVCETTGLTNEHLEYKLAQLDESDGRRDLKRAKTSTACACGAMVPARSMACQFCGEAAPPRSPFDVV